MLLTTDQATALVEGATRTRVASIVRVLRAHGLNPVKLRGKGNSGHGGRFALTCSQVSAVLLYHVLAKLRINDDCRYALLLQIARTPDEQLEAKLAAGQHYVCKVGKAIIPFLWTPETIALMERERGADIAQVGLTVETIDVRPFVEQVFSAARKLIAATADRGANRADA